MTSPLTRSTALTAAGLLAAGVLAAGTPAAEGVDQVRVNGRLVTWRTPETSYALEPAVGSYTRITPPYGYAQGAGGTLAVAYSEGDAKTAGARAVIQVVRTDGLPGLPGCG